MPLTDIIRLVACRVIVQVTSEGCLTPVLLNIFNCILRHFKPELLKPFPAPNDSVEYFCAHKKNVSEGGAISGGTSVFKSIRRLSRPQRQNTTNRPLGYERVHPPLHEVADTPFHIQGEWQIHPFISKKTK